MVPTQENRRWLLGKVEDTRSVTGEALTDFHTIRINGPDYLLFLKAKVYLIDKNKEDYQNNDVFHLIMYHYNGLMEGRSQLADLHDIEKE